MRCVQEVRPQLDWLLNMRTCWITAYSVLKLRTCLRLMTTTSSTTRSRYCNVDAGRRWMQSVTQVTSSNRNAWRRWVEKKQVHHQYKRRMTKRLCGIPWGSLRHVNVSNILAGLSRSPHRKFISHICVDRSIWIKFCSGRAREKAEEVLGIARVDEELKDKDIKRSCWLQATVYSGAKRITCFEATCRSLVYFSVTTCSRFYMLVRLDLIF